ncbi:MAG TPA: hypothetical protein VIL45_07040 [Thermoplasmata archaeon]
MPTTSQPRWKLAANLGDASPLECGGYLVFVDETGIYPPEAERIEEPTREASEDPGDRSWRWEIHRVSLDRCKVVNVDGRDYLVPHSWEPAWAERHGRIHEEWFAKDLHAVAETMDADLPALLAGLCSENPVELAESYRAVYDYHGWGNGDSYPVYLTAAELRKRYGPILADGILDEGDLKRAEEIWDEETVWPED